jgi:CRP-like cAMP-binding protein
MPNLNNETSNIILALKAGFHLEAANAHRDLYTLKQMIRDEGVRIYTERGKCMFRQGEAVDKFFLIANGGVALTRHCGNGSAQVLDFFFDDAVFSDMKEPTAHSTYSATCLVDTHAYAISAASIRRSFLNDRELMLDCNQLLMETLNRAYGNLINLGCCHGEERVAYILCMIHDSIIRNTCRQINIPVRQIDIANAVGMTPVYVNQILKSLKKCGSIHLNKGSVEILDISILRHICGCNAASVS